MNIEFERKKVDDWLEVRMSGRLDAQNAAFLEKELDAVIRGGNHRIRLQMEAVDYMSSAGIRILIKYAQALKKLSGGFCVDSPSHAVQTVLEMTGVAQMLAAPKAVETEADRTPETVSEQSFGTLKCTVFPVAPGAALACRLMGDPERFGKTPYTAADMTALPLPRGTMAVGLGAFGDGFEDCKPRFGEFLAAGGASVCMLTDGSKMPDYSVARGELVPEVQTLYAAVATGAFSHCVRFETDGETDAPLSQLIQAGLSILRTDAMGMVMIAETAGIIGAALKQSPALPMNQDHLFEHPGVRDWLRFAPEGVYNRTLALVAGLAAAKERPELTPFVRPMGADAFPAGHFHAAAFSYRALPKGALPLEDTLSDLFDEQSLLGLVHLLNDVRPINGAGESQFVRGAMWIGPVASIERSGVTPRAAL